MDQTLVSIHEAQRTSDERLDRELQPLWQRLQNIDYPQFIDSQRPSASSPSTAPIASFNPSDWPFRVWVYLCIRESQLSEQDQDQDQDQEQEQGQQDPNHNHDKLLRHQFRNIFPESTSSTLLPCSTYSAVARTVDVVYGRLHDAEFEKLKAKDQESAGLFKSLSQMLGVSLKAGWLLLTPQVIASRRELRRLKGLARDGLKHFANDPAIAEARRLKKKAPPRVVSLTTAVMILRSQVGTGDRALASPLPDESTLMSRLPSASASPSLSTFIRQFRGSMSAETASWRAAQTASACPGLSQQPSFTPPFVPSAQIQLARARAPVRGQSKDLSPHTPPSRTEKISEAYQTSSPASFSSPSSLSPCPEPRHQHDVDAAVTCGTKLASTVAPVRRNHFSPSHGRL